MAIPGQIVGTGKLITPGGQPGPKGDAGSLINAPLADATQNGYLRQVSGLSTDYVDGTNNCRSFPTGYNAIGNPNFEIDQRNVGTAMLASGYVMDRWSNVCNLATGRTTCQQVATTSGNGVIIPGTNFSISSKIMRVTCTTTQASLVGTDAVYLGQSVEGQRLRELIGGVHSVSILARSTVASLKFAVCVRTAAAPYYGISKLCTLDPTPNTWTLIQFPALPVWPSAGVWPINQGAQGYSFFITLAAGSGFIPSANDTWVATNTIGAIGQSNFMTTVNSTFDCAFVQHEAGPICNPLIDIPFEQNLRSCQRYYSKWIHYSAKACQGSWAQVGQLVASTVNIRCNVRFPVEMAKIPTIRMSGNSATLGTVYVDALGQVAYASMGVYASGIASIVLNAAGPANYVPCLGDWDADTGW